MSMTVSTLGQDILQSTVKQAKLLKQQMEMIQRQIESIYAKIAQLQKQEAEKNQMASVALPTVSDNSSSNVAGNNTKNIDVYV